MTIFLGGVAIQAAPVEARIDDSVATGAARVALERDLRNAYPMVVNWVIAPLVDHDDEVEVTSSTDIKVTRLGSRSAVRISNTGENIGRINKTLWFDVVGMQSVLTAARDLSPKQSLSATDAVIETRDVMAVACVPMETGDALVQMRVKRAMRAGSIICQNAIEPRPAVTEGEKVTVIYQSERVSIMTTGIAQQDGSVGQSLRVSNPVSKNSFVAVVTAASKVVVHD